jgi:hypothetical protein
VRRLPQPGELGQLQLGLAGLAEPALLPPLPVTRVVLASAHLDHDPGNNRPRNLAALCQRCHMLHDRAQHRKTRWRKRFVPRAAGDLFGTER